MALCCNTYRRGGVYWWRARFAGVRSNSQTVAFSLGVYDPDRARRLGMRLTAEADRLRRRLEVRAMSMEDVRPALDVVREAALAEPAVFTFSENALAQLDAIERRMPPVPLVVEGALDPAPTPERIAQVVAAIAAEDRVALARVSADARSQVQFDEDGRVLGIDNQPDPTVVMAFVYHAIAYRGVTAHLSEADKEALARRGRSPADIAAIAFLLRDVAASERRLSWRLGPTFDDLARRLVAAGISPSPDAVHAVRRHILLTRAATLDALAARPRYALSPCSAAAQPEVAGGSAIIVPTGSPASPRADESVSPAQPASADPAPVAQQKSVSLLALVEDLITKREARVGLHTRRQYRSVTKLFVKVAGTDDVQLMRQEHIGTFFDVLARLPKSHGKSPADETRSLDEIIARGEAAVARSGRPRAEMIGLDPPTIDRYVSQLGAILKYVRGRGHTIGDLSTLEDMREHDPERDEEKRLAFTHEDEVTLFSSPPWAGCLSKESRAAQGALLIHDSLYWAPLFAKYQLLSRSEATGIMLDDCITDAVIPSFWVRENALRGTKTPCRKRQTPFHTELIRLGILRYIELLRSLGFRVLFPDLVLRGRATPLGDLFDKIWTPVLDAALPQARSRSQTLHSFRKGGNTWLAAMPSVVAPEVRLQLMGHTPQSVNGRHYTAPFPLEVKLAALEQLPISTAHLQSAPIHLYSSVQEFVRQTRPAALII